MIGLGGCTLVNFILKAFPQSAIDIVEIRLPVVDLGAQVFSPAGRTWGTLKYSVEAGPDFICRGKDSGVMT